MSEFVSSNSDCLVFKLVEINSDTKDIDTTLYILYDKNEHKYIIRGQRRWTPRYQTCTYSFNCDFAHDLVDFIDYLICPSNTVNEILYNYNNLPARSDEITYEFLHDYDHRDYEISGYNDTKLRKKRLLRNLRMLRNVYNNY